MTTFEMIQRRFFFNEKNNVSNYWISNEFIRNSFWSIFDFLKVFIFFIFEKEECENQNWNLRNFWKFLIQSRVKSFIWRPKNALLEFQYFNNEILTKKSFNLCATKNSKRHCSWNDDVIYCPSCTISGTKDDSYAFKKC